MAKGGEVTSIRIPAELREWLREQADFYGRDFSAQVVWYLEGIKSSYDARTILDSRALAEPMYWAGKERRKTPRPGRVVFHKPRQ